jgi:ATP phosphoribosyltransferase
LDPFLFLKTYKLMERLKIAIQKSGRLTEDSQNLFSECSIEIQDGKRQLLAPSPNFPIDLLYLRDDDIPQYIEDGIADVGILGENIYVESGALLRIAKRLGFAKCRLSLAVQRSEKYSGSDFFQGKRIATTYPNIVKKYLAEKGISAEIHQISGSVEIAPNIGLADAICDIVSTGSTLMSNGLKEVETVMYSEALMVANQNLSAEKEQILQKLLFRIAAVETAKKNKYILLNAPNESISEICSILPGMKSPTILPLAKEGWSSLHSVVNEEVFWEVIDQLKEKGAQGILVVPIEKMIL